MKRKIFIHVLMVFCMMTGLVIPSLGSESTTVSCYAGNPDDNQYLGSLETFNVSNAASLCNNVFNDCNGNCTGCYIEHSEQVCIDSAGNRYLR